MNLDPSELSPQQIFEEILPGLARERPDIAEAINAVLAIELFGEAGGSWSLDLTGPPLASRGVSEGADCIIRMDAERFSALLKARRIAPWLSAFTKRKIKVEGDMPTVIKLGQMLNSAVKQENGGDR